MNRDEQGCRSGRRPPREQRLAAKEQARRDLHDKWAKKLGVKAA